MSSLNCCCELPFPQPSAFICKTAEPHVQCKFFVHVKNYFKYSKARVGSYMPVSTVVEIKENNKFLCQNG